MPCFINYQTVILGKQTNSLGIIVESIFAKYDILTQIKPLNPRGAFFKRSARIFLITKPIAARRGVLHKTDCHGRGVFHKPYYQGAAYYKALLASARVRHNMRPLRHTDYATVDYFTFLLHFPR